MRSRGASTPPASARTCSMPVSVGRIVREAYEPDGPIRPSPGPDWSTRMKLVHAADIHLDSPMHGLTAYDTAPVDELRLATRAALRGLVDLCLDEQADALLIGGDLYDGDWHDYATGAHFVREAQRLREAGIPVVIVTGNHDAASRITKALRLPDGVHVLPVDAPGTVVFEDLGLAVHGQGYATAAVTDDLSAAYPAPRSGLINVGLLPTSPDGRSAHPPYAPRRADRLRPPPRARRRRLRGLAPHPRAPASARRPADPVPRLPAGALGARDRAQ